MADQKSLHERIEHDFTYFSPTAAKAMVYNDMRAEFRKLALYIASSGPPSREQSLAITALEEALMWTNASIARNT